MKIFGFLNGLSRDYDPITTVIQSSHSLGFQLQPLMMLSLKCKASMQNYSPMMIPPLSHLTWRLLQSRRRSTPLTIKLFHLTILITVAEVAPTTIVAEEAIHQEDEVLLNISPTILRESDLLVKSAVEWVTLLSNVTTDLITTTRANKCTPPCAL